MVNKLPQKESLQVFLSYAKEDYPQARRIYDFLTSRDIQVWFDEENLVPGQEWRKEIERAIKIADVVIVCCSDTSVKKDGFIKDEIKIAVDKTNDKADGSYILIPARLDECDVPERLKRWQWADLYTEQGFVKLLQSLKKAAKEFKTPLPRTYTPSKLAELRPSSSRKIKYDKNEHEYSDDLYTERPGIISNIRKWIFSSKGKRVLSLYAPPGSGKTWLLRHFVEKLKKEERNLLVLWLNVPEIFDWEARDLSLSAFHRWFNEAVEKATLLNLEIPIIEKGISHSLMIEILGENICSSEELLRPIVIVDGYHEVPEDYQKLISKQIIEVFLARDCFRIIITLPDMWMLQSDRLRMNEQKLFIGRITDNTFAEEQMTSLAKKYYPGVKNITEWMETLKFYKWNNPLINSILLSKAYDENKQVLKLLVGKDLVACIWDVFPALAYQEFDFLVEVANKLNETWSVTDFENTFGVMNFYLSTFTKKMFEYGIFRESDIPNQYHIGSEFRNLLRDLKEL